VKTLTKVNSNTYGGQAKSRFGTIRSLLKGKEIMGPAQVCDPR